MRLLLYDTSEYYPSSPLYFDAVKELAQEEACQYNFFDQAQFVKPLSFSLFHKIAFRILKRRPITYWLLNRAFVQRAIEFHPTIILIVKGQYISPSSLAEIKSQTGATLMNFSTDDPFNPNASSRDLLQSIPLYDVYASTRRAVAHDIEQAGAKQIVYLPFGYKRSVHFREEPGSLNEFRRYESDVVFIGGCDKDRAPYFETLLKHAPGIRLRLYGGYWDRHPVLKDYWHGFAKGRDFRLALSSTKIAINLVRRTNRDGHVMRTFELPACGAFMLAERTEEHLSLLKEGREAAYFSSPEELSEQVTYYLNHDTERLQISQAGQRAVCSGQHTYTDRLKELVRIARSLPNK